MADVLNQDEVDALLSAIEEVDFRGAGERRAPGEVRYYDFMRPERLSTDQVRALEHVHEVAARRIGVALTRLAGDRVKCKLSVVDQVTYAEFLMSLPSPTCMHVLSCGSSGARAALELNPGVAFGLLEKRLGGEMKGGSPKRALTRLELDLLHPVAERVAAELTDAWKRVARMDFGIENAHTDPQLAQVAAPSEVVILAVFEVGLGQASGLMHLCIPYAVVEPHSSGLSSARSWFLRPAESDVKQSMNRLFRWLLRAEVTLAARIAETDMTVKEVISLRAGDVIRTVASPSSPLELTVEGVSKFLATVLEESRRKAVKIVGRSR